MKKEIRKRLLKAKEALIELAAIPSQGNFAIKRLSIAIEGIDDALEGKVRFPDKGRPENLS